MSSKFLYLTIDVVSISVPLIFSFNQKYSFYRQWKFALVAIAATAILFVAWDDWFTRIGVWGFNPDYVTGIYLDRLPIEEVLFFICVPYSCLFIYECIGLFSPSTWKPGKNYRLISDVLAVSLIITGIICHAKWYTSATFIALGALIGFLRWARKVTWKGKFYFAYAIILVPFFIVNGILTGTGIEKPIVLYNNSENLNIRIGTIPVEDIFYGMLLILVNVSIFEFLRSQKRAENKTVRIKGQVTDVP